MTAPKIPVGSMMINAMFGTTAPAHFRNLRAMTFTLSLAVLLPAAVVPAATDVSWKATVSGNFTDGTKWNGDSPPNNNITDHRAKIGGFSGSPNFTVTLDTSRSVAGLYFGNDQIDVSSYYTLTGANTLTIGACGITNNGGNNVISVNQITLGTSARLACLQTYLSSLTVSSAITDNGAGYWLIKDGPGGVTLSGASSFAAGGGIELANGWVRVGSDTALGSSVPELKIRAGRLSGNDNSTTRTIACPITLAGDVTLGGNDWSGEPYAASLIFQGAVTLTGNRLLNVVNCSSGRSVSFTGNIGDAGQGYKLSISGNGGNRSLVVSGNNTYGGGTDITSTDGNFPVCVDSNTGLSTGRLTVTQGNACFRSAGPSIASLAGAGGTVTLGTTGIDTTLTMGGDNSSSTFSGALVSASGRKGHIVKTGAGTLTLPGALTYDGTTTVNGGMLLVNGSLSANANAVTVNSGGTLGGTGTVNRVVSVGSGGGLSPGVDLTMGGLSTSNLTLAAGCTSVFHLGALGSGDRVAVNGNLSLEGTILVPPTGGIALGSHVIMTYTGTFAMPSRLVIQTPPGRPATLKVDTDQRKVMLDVAAAGTVVMLR